jgi:hypothetical protein
MSALDQRSQHTLGSRRSFHLCPRGRLLLPPRLRRLLKAAACAWTVGAGDDAAEGEGAGWACSTGRLALLGFFGRVTFGSFVADFGARVRFGFSIIVRSSSRAAAMRSGRTLAGAGAGSGGTVDVASLRVSIGCASPSRPKSLSASRRASLCTEGSARSSWTSRSGTSSGGIRSTQSSWRAAAEAAIAGEVGRLRLLISTENWRACGLMNCHKVLGRSRDSG